MSDGNTLFLQHFPQAYRGRNGRSFYDAVRDGADDCRKVASLVYRQTVARLKDEGLSQEQRLSWLELKQWLEEDRQGAMLLALYCLEWEEATPAERKAMRTRDREARAEVG